MNLHNIANAAIKTVHANENVILYKSLGQINKEGIVSPNYLEPQTVEAQVQSESSARLMQRDKANQSDSIRRIYMSADSYNPPPQALNRQGERGGDIIQREDGSFWLVTAVLDDFSYKSEWVCLECTLQTIEPDFSDQDWY